MSHQSGSARPERRGRPGAPSRPRGGRGSPRGRAPTGLRGTPSIVLTVPGLVHGAYDLVPIPVNADSSAELIREAFLVGYLSLLANPEPMAADEVYRRIAEHQRVATGQPKP